MKITIACVGKIKEKYLQEGIQEYSKRLNRYCNLQILEVPDEKTPEGASALEEAAIREKEGERLLRVLPANAYVIALAIEGDAPDSIQLSERISALTVRGISHIVFVIGGSLGLSGQVLQKADWKLSFSRMTFPHQLMRMILLEQIYRSFRILHHEPYHK
ncbi:MAG: 23S rRNA (pseudouridine(1915)-N(3))-methyltransferase RlmH [Bilifractor sp.]